MDEFQFSTKHQSIQKVNPSIQAMTNKFISIFASDTSEKMVQEKAIFLIKSPIGVG